MKNILNYYQSLFSSADCPKKFLLKILLPLALAFCISLYILSGFIVAAMGTKPISVTDTASLQIGISESILRLHVIANSDSTTDQATKLEVKDYVVSYLQNSLLKDVSSKEEAITVLSQHSDELKQITTKYVRSLGYTYDVEISIGPAYFPIKVYGDITLPAGEYDALRIKLGEANGQNWWCILFPTLCYVDTTYQIVPDESKEQLKDVLTEREYEAIVSKKETKVVVKFKIWEWIKELI
ncbi:MAG: stage II sporulation protein R [Clostridiales bacterium]|nr:stage II sporulation protein R [Clostridiales bacterium]